LQKYYYGYDEFLGDVIALSKKIEEFKPDTLLAVARGGLTLGHFIAQALDTRRLFALNSIHYNKEKKLDTLEIFNVPNLSEAKRVVIIDDIVDSGETLKGVIELLQKEYPNCEFKLATIFYKPTAIIEADYRAKEAHEWIDFFWEVDPIGSC
jgi:xanthine phosphoribosyltransferase